MKHVLDIQPIRLPARSVQRVEGGKGRQITCLEGVVWITQAKDDRDIILTRGQSFIMDRKGLTVIFALKPAAVAIGLAGHITAAQFDPATLRDLAA
ncbi:MAG: DUF2917 domain-containing protein [Hyphomonadaceae bacterium]|nr:DUF2917 domain-containing protein [Hyphomonadaceae bacterium]